MVWLFLFCWSNINRKLVLYHFATAQVTITLIFYIELDYIYIATNSYFYNISLF